MRRPSSGRARRRSTPRSCRRPSDAPARRSARRSATRGRERLGDSVPDWPAFPDSADALARLARHYKLIILSNVHRAGFAGSNRRLRGDFAAIITAEDVGAYKPAENHFRALDATLPGLGVERGALLHVAQSLFHDHVPAKREGLPSVWINRRHDRPGWGATPEPTEEWSYDLEFTSMARLRRRRRRGLRRHVTATQVEQRDGDRADDDPQQRRGGGVGQPGADAADAPSAWSTSSSRWWTAS